VDLFVRESGPVDAPAVVFLHGGLMSGWTWEPVLERMQQYRCLVPDLPQHGKSFEQGPFEMGRAAVAVAELIRARVETGRAHLVGYSLGAQVGVQLLATEPQIVDRAVLCGTFVNTMPGVQLVRRLAWLVARNPWFRWVVINRPWDARHAAKICGYREDVRLNAGAQLAHIAVASAGFTLPEGLDKSEAPTMFVTGSEELRFIRRCAAALAQSMPNGVDRVAIGMGHEWPMHNPELFSRTVEGWLSRAALPHKIGLPTSGWRLFAGSQTAPTD
jgi:pimeloyl-ACP methyl ester carboxylesterase